MQKFLVFTVLFVLHRSFFVKKVARGFIMYAFLSFVFDEYILEFSFSEDSFLEV